MKAILRLFMLAILAGSALSFAAPTADANDDYRRYQQVASYIRQAERYISSAKSYRNSANSYQRDADRYLREVENYNRRNDFDRARQSQRRAEQAMDRVRDYLRRADRADADAALNLQRAANLVQNR